MCDFCCLVDFEFCSRDIGICEPITDRDLGLLVDCIVVLGGILCGFPIIIAGLSLFLTNRCLHGWYPDTAGVSCYEILMRMTCFLFCVNFKNIYKKEENFDDENSIESKGLVFKFFYYLFCCFLCPSLVLGKKELPPVEGAENADEEGNEEEEDEDEGEGEGEEGAAHDE